MNIQLYNILIDILLDKDFIIDNHRSGSYEDTQNYSDDEVEQTVTQLCDDVHNLKK
jgi:hypothetical protein